MLAPLRPLIRVFRAAQAVRALRALDSHIARGGLAENSRALRRFSRALGVSQQAAEDVFLGALGPRASSAYLASAASTLKTARVWSWLSPRAGAQARLMAREVGAARHQAVQRDIALLENINRLQAHRAHEAVSLARSGRVDRARQVNRLRRADEAKVQALAENIAILGGRDL